MSGVEEEGIEADTALLTPGLDEFGHCSRQDEAEAFRITLDEYIGNGDLTLGLEGHPFVAGIAVQAAVNGAGGVFHGEVILEELPVFLYGLGVPAEFIVLTQERLEAAGGGRKFLSVHKRLIHAQKVVHQDADSICIGHIVAHLADNDLFPVRVHGINHTKRIAFIQIGGFAAEAADESVHFTGGAERFFGNPAHVALILEILHHLLVFLDHGDAEAVVALI